MVYQSYQYLAYCCLSGWSVEAGFSKLYIKAYARYSGSCSLTLKSENDISYSSVLPLALTLRCMPLAEKIKMESEKLATLTKKRNDLDKRIKKVESNLEKYKLIQNNNKYSAIEESAQVMGVSVEDVLAALKSGDMISLQERMEAAQEKTKEDTAEQEAAGTESENFSN